MESELERQLAANRKHEMAKYGRLRIYPEMRHLLKPQRAKVLDLVNHGLAMVDDVLDSSQQPLQYLGQLKQVFQHSFETGIFHVNNTEAHIVADLGLALKALTSLPFPHFTDRAIGMHTYEEVLNYWEMEERNIQRRGKVLDKKALDEITLGIGSLVASQFLFILDPPLDPYEFITLAKTYGLAVKLADNLCDFRDDVAGGFVNVPLEDVHHLRGIYIRNNRVIQVEPETLALSAEYMEREYERIRQVFGSADNLLLKARLRRPIWSIKLDERLYLFGQFCHSWLDQVRDFMDVEAARTHGYASGSENNN